MTILVYTSVWSLALRRDGEAIEPEVQSLKNAILAEEAVVNASARKQ